MFLRIDDGIEIPAVGDIDTKGSKLRTFHGDILRSEISRDVGELDGPDLLAFHFVFDLYEAGRRFHSNTPGNFWLDQSFLDANRDRADRAMTAHGQAAAGLDKEDGDIVGRIVWRVEDTAAHHVVAAGLEHESFADPVIFF